ncbi:MAG: T9SS type A sorting domain-containing protein [Crocinitomicaceae bacterium]|nr:T9SS type A sorting domain-containing protein [Flavobacteriales bacterium]NQZ35700.1 T9SS type A sorting domain-containing protein [Crocinitomicaceae bacterium]
MKAHLILLYSITTFSLSQAQEIISTQGDSYSNTTGTIEFTIGEVIIDTETNGPIGVTQGFHQTEMEIVGLVESPPLNISSIFPNPVGDILNVPVTSSQKVSYGLYDSHGKLIARNILTSENNTIEVSQLTVGTYSLRLTDESQNRKTFKFIKSH